MVAGSMEVSHSAMPPQLDGHSGGANAHNSSKLSASATVGIVAAVLFAVGAIVACFLWYKRLERRLRAQQPPESPAPHATTAAHADAGFAHVQLDSSHQLTKLEALVQPGFKSKRGVWDDPVIVALRVPTEDVVADLWLATTRLGAVHRGVFHSRVVAIKSLARSAMRGLEIIESVFDDIRQHQLLLGGTIAHARLVALVTVAWDSLADVRVVTEFMARGDLRAYLHALGTGTGNGEDDAVPVALSTTTTETGTLGLMGQKLAIACQVAEALAFLHTRVPLAVLHCELSSRRVLLDKRLDAKLDVFSLAGPRALPSAIALASLWVAPKVLTGAKPDTRADVYSLGVILSELDSNSLPFASAATAHADARQQAPLARTAILNLIALGKLTVTFSSQTPLAVAELVMQCLAADPHARPSAAEALAVLERAATLVSSAGSPNP